MLLDRKPRRRHTEEASWAVSYVDMLTLLLCFFIIFYNTNAEKVKPQEASALQKIILDLGKPEIQAGKGSGTGVGVGVGTGTGTGSGKESTSEVSPRMSQAEASFLSLLKGKLQNEAVSPRMKETSLEVEFENISFFSSGSTKLSPEAAAAVTRIMTSLRPYKDSIRITVQGHTDSKRVSGAHHFSDNWELSVLRATSVLKIFMQDGFSQEHLSAEGFADTQTTRTIASSDLSRQRRITLRIEPRLK
ncbi:MAG: OmpA family protein [Methylotenera sp.]|nr:OmpA family protein [Oligoflexia bacterium]